MPENLDAITSPTQPVDTALEVLDLVVELRGLSDSDMDRPRKVALLRVLSAGEPEVLEAQLASIRRAVDFAQVAVQVGVEMGERVEEGPENVPVWRLDQWVNRLAAAIAPEVFR